MLLTGGELAAIRAHAEADYPAECCGVVLVREGGEGPAERTLLRCRNLQDELHRQDPARHPRDSGAAYYMAPHDLLEIARRETRGHAVHVIYHSHIDADAYFSDTDRRQAMLDGEPSYPGTTHVVASVRDGRFAEARAFRWDAGARDFVETPLELG